MSNVLIVAKKEFQSILGNKFVIFAIVIYLIMILLNMVNNYKYIAGSDFSNAIPSLISSLLNVLTYYGSFLALIVGFTSMLDEKWSKALSVLVSKPLYRDTVIAGKLLGTLLFMILISIVVSCLYISSAMIVMGELSGAYVPEIISHLPVVFVLTILFIMIFLSLSMLLPMLIKDDHYALFILIVIWIILVTMLPSNLISGNIGYLFGTDRNVVSAFMADMSPAVMIFHLLDNSTTLVDLFTNNLSGMLKLVLFAFVPVIFSYIIFLRRDIR